MADEWTHEALERIDGSDELEIAVGRVAGPRRRWVPIWVVTADGVVYVRTWYRRTTGWFGRALESGEARIRVGGMETDVTISDVGETRADLRADVDSAYRAKYGGYGSAADRMLGDSAAATTLRLSPK